MHRKLRSDHPNIGIRAQGCAHHSSPRHNKQFVIKRRRTGVIVSKKSNGCPPPPIRGPGHETLAFKGLVYRGGGCQGGWGGVKRIANCELALCPDYSNRYYPRSSPLSLSLSLTVDSTLPPGMRFVVILGANRIHVASSTDATGYYAGTGRKLNIVRAPLRVLPPVRGPSPRKIADKLGKNRIVSAGAVGGHPPPTPTCFSSFPSSVFWR